MGRLTKGERESRKNKVARLITFCGLGLTEKELSQDTGFDRRTLNNYLRELDEEGIAHREGRKWWPY